MGPKGLINLVQLQTNLPIPYLGVGDTEHALYEAVLLSGLEDRDIKLPKLLHPFGVTSGPVLVTHLLQGRWPQNCTAPISQQLIMHELSYGAH